MNRVSVIGIAGVRRSGKNTVGEFLATFHDFSQTAFALPLKKAAMICFPQLTEEQVFGSSEKREEQLDIPLRGLDPRDGGQMIPDPVTDTWIAKDATRYGMNLTPRLILQTLGTEWGRRLHKDVWTDACWGLIENESTHPWQRWAVTDCRFRNEFEALRSKGGAVIKLLRGFEEAKAKLAAGNNADVHPSEREFLETPDEYFDVIIDNTGELEDLPPLIESAWEQLEPIVRQRREQFLLRTGRTEAL